MRLRQLDVDGHEAFRTCLANARTGAIDRDEFERQLESLRRSGRSVDFELPDDVPEVATRAELGEYLAHVFRDASPQIVANRAIWTWLTLAYFDVVCPAKSGAPGEDARYILADEPQRYYRHLLHGPYRVVTAHRAEHDGLGVLLGNPPDRPGDVWEQIASRQDLIASPKIVRALGKLYYDARRDGAKSGAATKSPGSVRRFVNVAAQLDCTWDLWEVPLDTLLEMLPEEFEPFLGAH